VAADALLRVENGAYANLVLPHELDRADLSAQDRNFATELVYGTTRMRRACDWLVDRYLMRSPDPATRAALRLGAYQLAFLRTPAHAAVGATVEIAPRRTRGMVNAVLRRVAADPAPDWPSVAVGLSYPDWLVDRLVADLGTDDAIAALERMNTAPDVTVRADGYVQDRASQWVAAAVGAAEGERIADICAAPGGKATALAAAGPALVVGLEVRSGRAALMASNVARLEVENLALVVGDGRHPPVRRGWFDRVLVDAPCSGLGVLRRRPDARWRIQPADIEGLVALQRDLVGAALALVRPGGLFVYSVCTLTTVETEALDTWLETDRPDLRAEPPGPPWRPVGRGGRVLPQDEDTDGMFVLRLRAGS
jgi:16S rRNA (cytosine967-C5)-methyltransferase